MSDVSGSELATGMQSHNGFPTSKLASCTKAMRRRLPLVLDGPDKLDVREREVGLTKLNDNLGLYLGRSVSRSPLSRILIPNKVIVDRLGAAEMLDGYKRHEY